MKQDRRPALSRRLDLVVTLSILVAAALLRSNLSYRTAFVDEAINLYKGWEMLQGRETYLINYHMGWPPLSALPLGFVGSLGGLEAARLVNASLGVGAVLFTMLTARTLYGKVAGYIAGGILASYGPAIFISSVVTYDSLSVLLVSIALYLWVRALMQNHLVLYVLGSTAMTLAVLTKYAAVMVALASVASALIIAAFALRAAPGHDTTRSHRRRAVLHKLVLTALPFLLLLLYAWLQRDHLTSLLETQVLTKRSLRSNSVYEILGLFANYLWLPLFASAAAVFVRGKRGPGLGLFLVGLSMVPYHLLNRDESTLFKHTSYMLVGLAPLTAGTIVEGVRTFTSRPRSKRNRPFLALVFGAAVISYLLMVGQYQLRGFRGYWPDTTELMEYLETEVEQGDTILMEGGVVAGYYLVAKGTPGRIPGDVVDTWSYYDEEGSGEAAYRRGISSQRFDFIVLSDIYTESFNEKLREMMAGRYSRVATFSTVVLGEEEAIEVFKPIEESWTPSLRLVTREKEGSSRAW